MRIWLITGGAGFIGSNFVRRALQEPEIHLMVLDALTYAGNLANLADLLDHPHLSFVRGDITDADMVGDLFELHHFEAVVHFAAESHVDRSIYGPEAFIRTNVNGTAVLLEAARQQWGHSEGRFLHVSTDEVFGSLEPDDPPFDENTPYRPSSPYSASKASSDHLAHAWYHTYGLPVMISNCSNNYGPWQFPEKLIPLMILNAIEQRALPVYGDGRQVRDWLHVADHCEALMQIMLKGEIGRTYCIGGNCERANIDLVHAIIKVVDARLQRDDGTSIALIGHVTDRPGHDRRYAINADRIRSELGWQPQYVIEEALPALVDWYLAHTTWAAQIRSGAYRDFYRQHYGN